MIDSYTYQLLPVGYRLIAGFMMCSGMIFVNTYDLFNDNLPDEWKSKQEGSDVTESKDKEK